MKAQHPSEVARIAVFRPNRVGDFMFALPALAALRVHFRHAEIVLLGQAWHAEFLAGRPGPVDRVCVVPDWAGIALAPDTACDTDAQAAFIAAMRTEKFDIAFQLYGGGRYANPLVAQLGAKLSIGFRSADAAPLDRWLPYPPLCNERLRLLEAVALAGAGADRLDPRLEVTPLDRDSLQRACKVVRPYVVLQPGVADPRRRWPAQHFAQVADALARRGLHIVAHGTEPERPLVEEVIRATRQCVPTAAIGLTLGALAALLQDAELMVSNDTGPLHLAHALGVPCVGIFLLLNLVSAAPLTQRCFRAAVSTRVHCPECGAENVRTRCPHDPSFLEEVAPDKVIALAEELLRFRRQVARAR